MDEILLTLNEFQAFARQYNFIPFIIKKKLEGLEATSLFAIIRKSSQYAFLLESGKVGRYTYLSGRPFLIVKSKETANEIIYLNEEKIVKQELLEGNSFDILRGYLQKYKTPKRSDWPKFFGGAVGFLSYDLVRNWEKIPQFARDDLQLPEIYLMFVDELWIYDHLTKELYFVKHIDITNILEKDLPSIYSETIYNLRIVWEEVLELYYHKINNKELNDKLEIKRDNYFQTDQQGISSSFSRANFIRAVERIKRYITMGDVYQVNLSIRQAKKLAVSGWEVYQTIRELNPSPYMGYICYPELEIVSNSPELLLQIEQGWAYTRPIAGTRPRGKNKEEDLALVSELINNEKERAEHIMLVDLERNDLGKISEFGTVDVTELMTIEEYSHVMHIVSNVRGKLRKEQDQLSAIVATFPGGTITGTPKVRTMEIIEELEPVRRGVYTGSIGWIGFHGDLELNIAIRTMVVKDEVAYIQAGAGVVIDSEPEREYLESLKKAEALWQAVELTERKKELQNI